MHIAIKITLWTLASLLVLLASTFLYLRNADLSVYEDQIEGVLSEAIGHKIDFDGLFELRFGGMTTLIAEDIRISNAHWQPDDQLLSVGHLSVTIDAWSLFSSPLIVDQLEVRDAQILLQENDAGIANWDTGRVSAEPADGDSLDLNLIAFKSVSLQNIAFVLDQPARERPLNATLASLSIVPDAAGVLDLDIRGALNEFPLTATGRLGPWQNLIDGRNLTADLDLTLGQVELDLEGSIADLTRLEGMNLSMVLQGPAIERVAELFGMPPFASGAFRIEGQASKPDDNNHVVFSGNFGDIEISATGLIDRFIDMEVASLNFSVSGPDTLHVAEVFGIEGAPDAPFQVSGDMILDDLRLEFSRTVAQIGDNYVDLDGWIDFSRWMPDGDVTISAAGPDFSVVAPFLGLPGIPHDEFEISGRVRKSSRDVSLENVVATIGDIRLVANGALDRKGPGGAEIFVSVSGPDISVIGPMTGLLDVPQKPFLVSTYLRPDPIGINLDEAKLIVGDNHADIDGVIGTVDGVSGTNVTVHGFGPELHSISLLTGTPYLPYGAYDYTTRISIDDDVLTVDNFDLTVVGASAAVTGSVNIGSRAGDFDLRLAVSSEDVSQLELFESLKELDGEALQVNGQVRHRSGLFSLSAMTADIGNLGISVNGDFDSAELSAKLVIGANAPDSEMLSRFLGDISLPDGPVLFNGDIQRSNDNIEFTDTSFRVGDFSIALDGTLSNSPLSNNSDLSVRTAGPDLKQIGEAFGIKAFPPKTFDIAYQINGIPTGFAIENIDATIGENAVTGRFTADLRDKPTVTGELSATYLDLSNQLAKSDDVAESAVPGPYVFPDTPLPLDWLESFDASIDLRAGRLILTQLDVHDFHIGIDISDGGLKADPISLGESAGRIFGHIHVLPVEDRYELDTTINVDNIHVGVRESANSVGSGLPAVNGKIELRGSGNSPHELMAGSNGRIALSQSSGRTNSALISRLFGDLITQIIETLNPLSAKETYTILECAFYNVNIENGMATIENFVIQTEKVTMAAQGSVNFENEALRLSVNAKPRKGFGISVGGIANSFLNVRGTLKSPALGIDAAGSMTTTGAALATAGLSLVAKGLWDRVSAEKGICDEMAQNNN